MNRSTWTSRLLLVTTALLFSGAVQSLHESLDHALGHAPGHAPAPGNDRPVEAAHAYHHGHDHVHRGGPDPRPVPSAPTDHDDCATCFLLTHAQASPLDFDAPPTLPGPGVAAAIVTSPAFVLSNDSPLPPGRGPPSARL